MSDANTALDDARTAFESGTMPRDTFWLRMREQHALLEAYTGLVGRGELASIEIHATGLQVVFTDGLRMGWRPSDTRSVPSVTVNHGHYEPHEVRALCALARSSRSILDVGANAGFMALKMARAEPRAHVHAFEPIPGTHAELARNVELNGLGARITAHRQALAERPGTARFFVPAFHGSVAASARPLFEGENSEVEVELSTLDAFVAERQLTQLDLMKCDVEGAELFVLRGGMDTLRRFRPVLMLEMLRKWARAFDYHPNAILECLLPLGYRCYSLEAEGLREHGSIDDETTATNFFFLDPTRHAAERARLESALGLPPRVVPDLPSVGLARRVRRDILKMVQRARASHVGSCFSAVDVLCVLYASVLRVEPAAPEKPARDRFILSKGHAAAALYATLAESGFFPTEWLDHFCEDGSPLAGHVVHKGVPGVEVSTGSLGHGLSLGAGMALAARGSDGYRVFVLLSDGECDEGSVWEAALFGAHQKLDNLVAIVDRNRLQGFGRVQDVLELEPFADKWRAFGWDVVELDGHDHAALTQTLRRLPLQPGKPTLLLANTVKGKGVSFMEDRLEWHYRSPSGAELELGLAELADPTANGSGSQP